VAQITLCGLDTAFVDIDDDLNIAPRAIANALDNDTLAVVAPHMYGAPCQIAAIEGLCRDAGVGLIDDAAQVVGVRAGSRMLGTFGDFGLVSFAQSKAIVTGFGGSGGMLFVNNPEFVDESAAFIATLPRPSARVRYLGCFIWSYLLHRYTNSADYYMSRAASRLNLRLPPITAARIANLDAAVALVQWRRLQKIMAARIRIAEAYQIALAKIPQFSLPQYASGRFLTRLMLELPTGIDSRTARAHLLSLGIETRMPYPEIHASSEPQSNATRLRAKLIEVPSSVRLGQDDIASICSQFISLLAL